VSAHGYWLEVLLLLDGDDHLLEVVWGNVALLASANVATRVLPPYTGPRDGKWC
jgi:hypothetical protein